ncbi:MAG TPA: carboxypeptidase-like regulatory domain-containing protein [Anaeromyxobacteraceae bacterium]|nr:carboxypeptidase-like regulatory domain-containing protein [Anaeromyxobacteraceae bacterium]
MATETTATLTASVPNVAPVTVSIAIDPASMALGGKVIAPNGTPVAAAVVRVGSSTATTDAAGAFSLTSVAPPYDITATAPSGLLTSVYPGMRRMDPTLVIFDTAPAFPLSAYLAGTLSGGAGFPQPAGHEAGVSFASAEANGSCPVLAGSSTFFMDISWSGASSEAGTLHALQWTVDANGRPVSYDGYGNRTGVTLTSGSTVSGQDIALAAIQARSVSGTIDNSVNSNVAVIAMFTVLPDGARIRVLPPPSDPSPYPSPGFQSTFSIPTPVLPSGKIDVVSFQGYVGGAYQEVHRHGLAADASGVAIQYGGLPMQNSPAEGATEVGPGTTFTWFAMPDSPVYVASFRGPSGSPGYDVFATAQSLTIPTGFALPSNAAYTWWIRGSSAFSTVDDAAGPGGFFASAASYRVAEGPPRQFTTAP